MEKNNLIALKGEVEQASCELKNSVGKLENHLSETLKRVSNSAERTISQAKDFLRELNPIAQVRKHPMIGFGSAVALGALVSYRRSRRQRLENRILEQIADGSGQIHVLPAQESRSSTFKRITQTILTSVATAAAAEIGRRALNTQDMEPGSYSVH